MRAVEPHSEADPVSILAQVLVAAGNVIGRNPHFMAEEDRHGLNEFIVCVGPSGHGRKGTAWGRAKKPIIAVDPSWKGCVVHGLTSGEGLIHHVRDPVEKKKLNGEIEVVDAGVYDKRLFAIEAEFGRLLAVMKRLGNTLSAVVRCAWDGDTLQTLTKNSAEKATGAHISVVGHITKDEVLSLLHKTEAANGFGNRFLWLYTQRSKCLPEGGQPIDISPFVERPAYQELQDDQQSDPF